MKGKKRYSNVTFSKRVDHEAGRHRPPRGQAEPAVCKECGAIYVDRRWVTAETALQRNRIKQLESAREVICPGCKRRAEGVPSGFVYLEGSFLNRHKDEIEHFLRNEAERAAEDNPVAQIMSIEKDQDGRFTVTTTTEHLAQRIGEALHKAFAGTVRYDFSHENKLARVYWRRNAPKAEAKGAKG